MKRVLAAAALLAGLGAALTVTPAAHASVTPCAPSIGSVSATTHLTNRPDSGGNGTWATDTLTRTFKLTLVSQSAGIYTYTGTVCDGGTFLTIPGAFTPNQGAPFTGDTIADLVKGTVNGTAFFSFTADQPADISLVPPTGDPGAPTSTWYQQAFPAGTVFGGTGLENNWSWSYQVIQGFFIQNWLDAASNSGGQVPSAGNITG